MLRGVLRTFTYRAVSVHHSFSSRFFIFTFCTFVGRREARGGGGGGRSDHPFTRTITCTYSAGKGVYVFKYTSLSYFVVGSMSAATCKRCVYAMRVDGMRDLWTVVGLGE